MPPITHPSDRRPHRARVAAVARALLLAVSLVGLPGWLPGLPTVTGAAWADDDGDDGGAAAGGAGAGGATSAGADGGADTDAGRVEPAPAVNVGDVVSDELLALDPSAAALQRAARWGAQPVQTTRHASLGITVVRLRLPPGIDARTALQLTEETDPGVFDLHHRFALAQAPAGAAAGCDAPGCDARRPLRWPDSARCGQGQVVGIVDTAVATDLPALRGADVRQRVWAPAGAALPDAVHGTEVATLLVGQLPAHAGLLPRASLRAAMPFQRLPGGEVRADAAGLVASLDWLLAQRVGAIGMSLAGPPNRVLEAAVRRTVARGVPVVAAVGNGGPGATPAHPAAVDGVLGATAVSADARVYWRASRGAGVDFALPGVGLALPQPDGSVRPRSGTSYAVPHLLALVSQTLAEGRLTLADWVAGDRVPVLDLGAPGRDDAYGWGLPRPALTC